MTRLLCSFAIGLCLAQPAWAQQPPETLPINDLSAPTSPAFVLLDVAPAAVERPDTPKAFVVSALNKFANSDGGFPKDFALQVLPYWMKSHPDLSLREYQQPGLVQSLLQTFSISVATSPIQGATAGADPLGSKLGLGFTARLWNGRPNPTLDRHLAALETAADVVLDLDEKMDAATTEAERKKLQAEMAAADARVSAAAKRIGDLDAERVGFFLTLSGGQAWDFFQDDVRNAKAKRWGAWATAAYRITACPAARNVGDVDRSLRIPQCLSSLDFLGVARVLKDSGSDEIVDYGARLLWSPSRQFNASVEYVRRNAPQIAFETESNENSSRVAGIVEYRIREDIIFYGTFGQDFETIAGEKPLLSLMGLNFGFGQKATVRNPAAQPGAKPRVP